MQEMGGEKEEFKDCVREHVDGMRESKTSDFSVFCSCR
jgi:hypothetical protein